MDSDLDLDSDLGTQDSERLRAGDSVGLEREDGAWMKGVVVLVESDGIDVVVDGRIREGEVLSVSRTVTDDASYSAAIEVVSAGPGRSRVRLVDEWKRVQMREFVRVAVLGVTVDVAAGESSSGRRSSREAANTDGSPNATHRLIDLSAGGLRFESDASYATGDELELSFTIPRHGKLTVRGAVVRVAGRRRDDPSPCQYAVAFCDLEETMRVKIMTMVLAEQARRFRESAKPEPEEA